LFVFIGHKDTKNNTFLQILFQNSNNPANSSQNPPQPHHPATPTYLHSLPRKGQICRYAAAIDGVAVYGVCRVAAL
jgi:hypothetical protein